MLEKATVLTTLFPIVDDAMKGSAMIQEILKRPGPTPSLSDSEVVTIALYQELIGEPREDHFFCLHAETLRAYFPDLNERSCYNRRKRDLWSVILAVRICLQIVLDAFQLEETAVIDSAPVPCVGYKRSKANSDFVGHADYGVCSSKAMKYFRFKLHTIVSLTGVVMSFLLTPANRSVILKFSKLQSTISCKDHKSARFPWRPEADAYLRGAARVGRRLARRAHGLGQSPPRPRQPHFC